MAREQRHIRMYEYEMYLSTYDDVHLLIDEYIHFYNHHSI